MILKAENIPRIGDEVINEKLKPIGTVFDIFGPTSSPYVAVKPHMIGANSDTNGTHLTFWGSESDDID